MYVRVLIIFLWACNEVLAEDASLDVDSRPAKRGELPWHAVVYSKATPYNLFCGGSIVRPNVVISVAHCYWNETSQMLKPASMFAVAAGKVNRPWDDPEDDEYAQKSDVDSIHVPSRYRGWASSFVEDISVLLLSKPFVYNVHITPVYIDFDKTLDRAQTGKENIGKIPTWRLKTSPTLKVVKLQIVPYDKCFTTIPFNFRPFVGSDKFCARSKENGTAPCHGDTGSGLVIPETDRGETHYYLRGVYSVAPKIAKDGCGDILGFTHVIQFENFLRKYLSSEDVSFNVGSRLAKRGELPWHAVVYLKTNTPYKVICGGSIVKPNMVISVAHCYWNETHQKLKPASNYAVAAGKVNRPWDDPEDNEFAQKSDVESINIPSRYRGLQSHYIEDISVMILSKSFEYNQHVAPIHLDFEENLDRIQIDKDKMGKVPTWRLKTSPSLKVVVLMIVPFDECFSSIKRNFRPFIGTSDKICASSKDKDTAPCHGDTGSGLVIPENERGETRYYLRGVYSVAPKIAEDGCGDILGFTHVLQYRNFLSKYLPSKSNQEPIPSDKCQLPAYPPNGRYQVHNAPNASPFQISDFWIVDITCDPGYGILDGENRRFCSSGKWSPTEKLPECVPFCKLNRHPSVQYRCRSSGSASLDTRACNDHEPPGTIAIPECVKPNYFSSDELSFIVCNSDGIWSDNPRCLPACGEVTPGGVVLIRNGEYAKLGELPWHAGIYQKTTTPYKQICGGSIVRPSVVISAAHCFWNDKKPDDQKLLPASDYAVAVGKLYRPWDDPEDNKYAQKADVISINIPSRFHGISSNYMDDLAVLLLSKSFEYKPHIAPVCLSFEDLFDRQQITKGILAKVAGWGVMSPSGNSSPSLKVVELPMVSYLECYDASPLSFKRYITGDKICAGYKNKGIAVCLGDSGGGLVVAGNDRGITRYYLRGIVSAAPDELNHCTANEITTFTHVHYHGAFIKSYL